MVDLTQIEISVGDDVPDAPETSFWVVSMPDFVEVQFGSGQSVRFELPPGPIHHVQPVFESGDVVALLVWDGTEGSGRKVYPLGVV